MDSCRATTGTMSHVQGSVEGTTDSPANCGRAGHARRQRPTDWKQLFLRDFYGWRDVDLTEHLEEHDQEENIPEEHVVDPVVDKHDDMTVTENVKLEKHALNENQHHMGLTDRVLKYYSQRHRLFHKFDQGIQLDEESWYSVTPEKIARHIATRFANKSVIMELFAGAGGNYIQFALQGAYVLAVEISPKKIQLGMNNANVYGVLNYIEFIQADVYQFLPLLISHQQKYPIIDAVFLSPPWGGPQYNQYQSYDVTVFADLIKSIRKLCNNIAVLLPRNSDINSIRKCFGKCEIERNYLSHKCKTITVYVGDLINNPR